MEEEKTIEIQLAELWDRLSELAGGNLWSRLTKKEWELANKLFNQKELT